MRLQIEHAQVTREMLASFPWNVGVITGKPGTGKTFLARQLWPDNTSDDPFVEDNFLPTPQACNYERSRLNANLDSKLVLVIRQDLLDTVCHRLDPDWIITTDWTPGR